MYSSAIPLRRVGFIGRLAVAACFVYIGSIVALAANPIAGTFARASSEGAEFCVLSCNDVPAHFHDHNNIPDSATDIDEPDASSDLNCDNPGQDAPQLCIVDLDAVTLRTPEVIRLLHVPVRCFYCLHECIRERSPPHFRSLI